MGLEALEVLCGFGGENNLVFHSGHNIARLLCRVNNPWPMRGSNAQLRGLTISRRAAASSSLLFDANIYYGHLMDIFSVAAQNDSRDISNNQYELNLTLENFFLSSSIKYLSISSFAIGLNNGKYL